MSDTELIIRFLEKAEQRTRRNRRLNQIASILCISLLFPVTFKALDFIFLFRGTTVSVFFLLWGAATLAWIIWRVRDRHPLSQIAANVDRKAQLHDQMKTAYWFIQNPRSSEWIEAQIGRTAREAKRIQVESLYPRRIPRTSYIAAALVAALIGLNFIPLSFNYNWLRLQAAPAFRLRDDERASLEQARKLLQQARALENARIAEKVEEVIEDLEEGNITVQEAVQELQALAEELEQSELDLANTTNGLTEMAEILKQAVPLEALAAAMNAGDLTTAATEVRSLSQNIDRLAPADRRDVQDHFQQASQNPRTALENLAASFENTSEAMLRGDTAATRSALDRTAREFEYLMEQISDQQLRTEAGMQLGELAESLEQREGEGGDPAGDAEGGEGEQAENAGAGAGQQSGQQPAGEPQTGAENGEQGETGTGEGEDSAEAAQAGEGQAGGQGENGQGGNSFGGSMESAPLEGEITSLDVQLQQELLAMQALETGAAGAEAGKDEAAGERERSKLDYRNVPSDLSPAQKDLLNQERIPFGSRQLIKDYFQAVKPPQNK